MAGEVPGHLQNTAKVPLSKVVNPQMLMAPLCGSLITLCHLSLNTFACIFKMPDVFKFLILKINMVFLSFFANPGCSSEFSVPHGNSNSQLIYAHRNHK